MNSDPRNFLGRISEFFINKYRVVYLILAALVLMGVNAYMQLPREEQPEIVVPYAMVAVSYSGAAPNEVESLITDKIEGKLEELGDVKAISSTSSNGISTVLVEFNPGVDMEKNLQEIRNKIADLQDDLPEDAGIPVVRGFETGAEPIMVLNVSGAYDLITLKNIAEAIQKEIKRIDGIKEVEMVGGLEREINIYIDPAKLAAPIFQ
ncbi:hypothetical protein N752_27035 [Desulforamulus aquiferis]|nr:hypothetical protein N752_27035 [Desulforamulus aquiferis]